VAVWVNGLCPDKGALVMGVVWYRLRADVRVRWRTLALIAVLVGVGGLAGTVALP
jgi:hypothetical protein